MFDNIFKRGQGVQLNPEAGEDRKLHRDNAVLEATAATQEFDRMELEGRNDLVKWQQDLRDELEKLKHKLKGEVWNGEDWEQKVMKIRRIFVNEETGKKEVKIIEVEKEPMCNDLFIDFIDLQIEPFLSRNLINSNLKEDHILQILRSTSNDIVDALVEGFDMYDISFNDYDQIMRMIKNVIIPAPFRALNDGERKHQRAISKRIESYSEHPQQQKRKKILGVI